MAIATGINLQSIERNIERAKRSSFADSSASVANELEVRMSARIAPGYPFISVSELYRLAAVAYPFSL
jgi:hypothetical protein